MIRTALAASLSGRRKARLAMNPANSLVSWATRFAKNPRDSRCVENIMESPPESCAEACVEFVRRMLWARSRRSPLPDHRGHISNVAAVLLADVDGRGACLDPSDPSRHVRIGDPCLITHSKRPIQRARFPHVARRHEPSDPVGRKRREQGDRLPVVSDLDGLQARTRRIAAVSVSRSSRTPIRGVM